MLSSPLYRKLFPVITVYILGFCLSVYFLTVPHIRRAVYSIEEGASRTILNNVCELVNSNHLSMEAYRRFALDAHKQQLKNIVDIGEAFIKEYLGKVQSGVMEEGEAKKEVMETIGNLRYGKNNYVWVSDYSGYVLYHPDPEYHNRNVLGVRDIHGDPIMKRMLETARKKGDGYTTYWWQRLGERKRCKKLAYSRDFPELGWVLTAGVYLDDVEKALADRQEKMVEELREIMGTIRIARTGYMYIFDSGFNMIVHSNPDIENTNFSNVTNPATGTPLCRELAAAARTPEHRLYYKWDKPDDRGNYIYNKISWIRYFEDFDWYIASSVYTDELNVSAEKLKDKILWLTGVSFFIALIVAAVILDRFLSPLRKLSNTATSIKDGNLHLDCSIQRNDEIGSLASAINSMVEQLRNSITFLDERVRERTAEVDRKNTSLENEIIVRKRAEDKFRNLNLELEERVKKRTADLEKSLRDLEDMQEQLIQSEKMSALGVLVAGVAHEINTPVGIGITMSSYILQKTEKLAELYSLKKMPRSEFEGYLQIVSDGAKSIFNSLDHAGQLITNFKQVAVDQSSELRREFEVKGYVKDVVAGMGINLRKSGHTVAVNCPEELSIDSYPGAFTQVITNLVMNSLIHGFEGMEGGKITIDISLSGGNLNLCYDDNGLGMSKENLQHLFDPFFTTKRTRGGTGLGMHIVYNIVTQKLGGTIHCQSFPGKGVTFTIRVPVAGQSLG